MKKRDLKSLALLGLAGGLLLAAQPVSALADAQLFAARTSQPQLSCGVCKSRTGCGATKQSNKETAMRDTDYSMPPQTQTMNPNTKLYSTPANSVSEEKLRNSLSTDVKKIFDSLDSDAKALVLDRAAREPKKDRNEIVKEVRDEMSQQNSSSYRSQSTNGKGYSNQQYMKGTYEKKNNPNDYR